MPLFLLAFNPTLDNIQFLIGKYNILFDSLQGKTA